MAEVQKLRDGDKEAIDAATSEVWSSIVYSDAGVTFDDVKIVFADESRRTDHAGD